MINLNISINPYKYNAIKTYSNHSHTIQFLIINILFTYINLLHLYLSSFGIDMQPRHGKLHYCELESVWIKDLSKNLITYIMELGARGLYPKKICKKHTANLAISNRTQIELICGIHSV